MDIIKILLEAEEDTEPKEETIKIEPDEENESSYSDEAEDDVAEAEEEEVETEEDDTPSDDETETEDTSEEDTEESEDDTSYTDEAEDSIDTSDTESADDTSDSSSDASSEETKEDPDELIKKDALLKDFINLYENTKLVMDKLDKIPIVDMLINRVVIQVRKNFSKMNEYIYDIITRLYDIHGYVKNLYVYNYFIESYRINVEMLKKINVFTLNA